MILAQIKLPDNVCLFHLIINDCIVHHKKQNVTQNKKCCIFFSGNALFRKRKHVAETSSTSRSLSDGGKNNGCNY